MNRLFTPVYVKHWASNLFYAISLGVSLHLHRYGLAGFVGAIILFECAEDIARAVRNR
jgi:hypothetical protein